MSTKNKKNIYSLDSQEALSEFNSDREAGLSDEEARQRLREYGLNALKKKRSWKWLRLISNQFNDALVWILLVAAILAFFFSEYRDTTIILIIVFLNATIGFFQEFKAERILASIRKLTKDKALVIRGKEKKEIDSRFVVPGDIIFVSSGDSIPADGLLLEAYELRVNSFVFTGESKPKKKEAKALAELKVSLADIDNMLFMGETVATGEGLFLVTATGMDTELGKIANLAQEVKDDLTPMQKQMRTLGRDVTILSLFIGAIVLIAGQYFRMSLYQNFLFALALSVSVVPEGLPAAISVALSLGMKRLLKNKVLAKKLNAVETLGSVSMVCSDKTGTITRNELTVVKVVLNDNEVLEIDGAGYEPQGNFYESSRKINPKDIKNLELLFKIGSLCNDASLIKEDGAYKIIGDPTEGAIIVAGKKYESGSGYFAIGEKKIDEKPFSSERMRMSVIYKNKDIISFVKGSPDVMIDLCKFRKVGDEILEFTKEEKDNVKKVYNDMSAEALRVLAFAYRNLNEAAIGLDKPSAAKAMADEAEKNLVWVGMMAMIDPPRRDVTKALVECRKLGIRVIMITGDYAITAKAIAQNVGLIEKSKDQDKNSVIDGKTLDVLNDKELYQKIKSGVCVFARIAPEQKLRIASVLKKYGEVIAMTGDGVNDAPALKRADIGVAMGIMGTDVSKEAADMILMDDNFASIVHGVEEGRIIFNNLKKFVHYVFTSNASELITVLFGVLLQIPSPVSAIQILAVDLGTDIFPSFSLGLEPKEPDMTVERRKRANSKDSVMTLKGFRRIIYIGIIMATGAVVTFLWSMTRGGWHFGDKIALDSLLYVKSTTAAYAVLAMSQLANLLQSRSETLSPFQLGFFKNRYAIFSVFISISIFLSFMYVPLFQKYLHMLPIDAWDWLAAAATFLAVFIWEEGRKAEENKDKY